MVFAGLNKASRILHGKSSITDLPRQAAPPDLLPSDLPKARPSVFCHHYFFIDLFSFIGQVEKSRSFLKGVTHSSFLFKIGFGSTSNLCKRLAGQQDAIQNPCFI